MLYDTKHLENIVVNLDSRRIPLNAQQRQEIRGSGKYPYIGANGVIDFIDEFIFDEEILCIAEDGGDWSFGSPCAFIVRGKSWVNNHAHVVTTKEGTNIRYLCHYLNYADLSPYITGTTRGKLTQRALNAINIPHPPLEIQGRIAEILDKAQELIDKRQRQIELLDEFLQSVFLDMFGDPVSNPKGWITKRVEEFTDVITGNTPPRKDVDNYGDYIEWIKSDNINTPSHYITAAVEHLSERGLEKGRSVDSGAILMTCIAGSISCIGNVALTDRRVAFNQQINALVPKDMNLYFLYTLLLVSKDYIQRASTNSMKGMISKGNLEKLEFISPPSEKQLEFQGLFLEYLHQRELFERSITEMQNLFDSIMQRAFKGELFN